MVGFIYIKASYNTRQFRGALQPNQILPLYYCLEREISEISHRKHFVDIIFMIYRKKEDLDDAL